MLVKQAKAQRLAKRLTGYLKEVLGLELKAMALAGEKLLPLFLRELYAFFRIRILGTDFILMVQKDEVERTTAILAKHMRQLREKWGHDFIFVNEAVSSLARKRMIEQGIPFIIPGNQMYLPMLGLDLREHFRKIQTSKPTLSPSTQVFVLDALYHHSHETDTPTKAAKRLGYSTMTMTRAFHELEQTGLGTHTVQGKERRLSLPQDKKALWETALPFLASPVKKRSYIGAHLPKGNRLKSGLSALCEYSNLAPPETMVFAVEGEEYRQIEAKEIQISTLNPGPEWMGIEYWTYPPGRFGKKGLADPLSVYLSLKDEDDERVQSALEELIKGMRW